MNNIEKDFKSRINKLYELEYQKTSHMVFDTLDVNNKISFEEIYEFIKESLHIKILNSNLNIFDILFSHSYSYVICNTYNKNHILKDEFEFINFVEKIYLTLTLKEDPLVNNTHISYMVKMVVDDKPQNFHFSVYVKKLNDNKHLNNLTLTMHLNVLLQKLIIIYYTELKKDILKTQSLLKLEKNKL